MEGVLKSKLHRAVNCIREGMATGGVLIVDLDGYTLAPALAAFYLAVEGNTSLMVGFATVKRGRVFSSILDDTKDKLEKQLRIWNGEKK
mmetsp:Transcript_39124/g.75905  ORF Transcript_39124/g.75905 Transcript_39124/m.75905 type:complete len:89 (+) Transcript_39124:587-853(+)